MCHRISHCIHGLGLGGAQKVLETLATSFLGPGIESFVYCSLDGPVRDSLEASGVRVRVIPRALPKFDPIWVRRLSHAMKTDQIDVVHTHLFGDSLHGYLAARVSGGLPVVVTLHNNQVRFSRLQQRGYRWLLPRCSAVVACAPSVGASFVADQPGLKGKLTVVPNGIDFDKPIGLNPVERSALRAEIGLRADALVLVAMGRLTEQKGYSFLIQAFSELPEARKEQTQLLLMGTGPLESSIRELAESLGLSGRVIFGGYRQDVRRILSTSDVVAFSSLWEGLPIALLEAMASEKCIVATNIEAFRDVVAHESEALLARPADPQDLSAAIERALSDSSLRARLGNRARVRFSKQFTAEKMVRSYANLYGDVLAAEVGSGPES